VLCPACEGQSPDCPHCDGAGHLEITTCPRAAVPDEVWEVMSLCDDAQRGLLPVDGGVLDQAAAFNTIRRFVRYEISAQQAPAVDEATQER
jgi:hypothetical protein